MENLIESMPAPVNAPCSGEPHPDLISRKNRCLLPGALALGILFNLLFYKESFGISYLLFILGFYGVALTYTKPGLKFKWNFDWLLGIPVVALALGYFFYSNAILSGLNLLVIPALVVAQTLLLTRNNRNPWYTVGFGGEVMSGLLSRPVKNLTKPFQIIALIQPKTRFTHYTVFKKVLLGLVIAAPMLLMVIALLSSADQIFGRMMENLVNTIFDINLGDSIVQLGIIGAVSLLSFSFLYGLNHRQSGSNPATETPIASPKVAVWDPVIVITILSCLNLIYVLFCLVQFSYLFGSLNSVLPYAFSYAEYARRGFFELNFITLINLAMLLANLRFIPQDAGKIHLAVKLLNTLLVTCTLVLDISAHFRMSLYEEVYGYTYLRLLTHAFMGVILAWLVASLWRIWNDRVQLLKAYIVIGLTAWTLINYINIDAVIARQNITRYHKTGKIDVAYLNSLSYEAIPELAKLLKDQDREVVGEIRSGLLAKQEKLDAEESWQSFNLSKARARRLITRFNPQTTFFKAEK